MIVKVKNLQDYKRFYRKDRETQETVIERTEYATMIFDTKNIIYMSEFLGEYAIVLANKIIMVSKEDFEHVKSVC